MTPGPSVSSTNKTDHHNIAEILSKVALNTNKQTTFKLTCVFSGLWSESSSSGFIVDTTAPVVSTVPTFSVDFGIKGLTQIYRTSMKVQWTVDDPESYIKRQYLSINSHKGGEFPLSSQSVRKSDQN